MMLSDGDLRTFLDSGDLRVSPLGPDALQPSSIDLRLDWEFRVFDNHRYTHIDPATAQLCLTRPVLVEQGEPFVLHPGEFVLASTQEEVSLSGRLAAQLNGKSSLGRLGLVVHSTAGFIDPGFSGTITLELSNVARLPLALWPGTKIGQLVVFELRSPCLRPYGGAETQSRYQGQRGPTPSRSHERFTAIEANEGP